MTEQSSESSESRESLLAQAIEEYFTNPSDDPADTRQWLARYPAIQSELEQFLDDQSFLSSKMSLPDYQMMSGWDPGDEPTIGGNQSLESAEEQPIDHLGDYEVIQEIARGGMGVVYKARQKKLNRTVALKTIVTSHLSDQADKQRFRVEAEAAAQLDHASIVKVFEVGEQDGVMFFSMSLVDGGTLRDEYKNGPCSPVRAASLMAEVASAVHYAHTQGVIHRDIKPANILMDADGRPQITDFGLAKLNHLSSDLTTTGQILGTPSYMAPEQAWGDSNKIGPATDIYGLGATLYSLLTGEPPFAAERALDVIAMVRDQSPVPVRHLAKEVPSDLAAIVMKCLAKEPADRYHTAAELARDLKLFVSGDRVSIESMGLIGHVGRALSTSRNVEVVHNWGWSLRRIGWLIITYYTILFSLTTAEVQSHWIELGLRVLMLVGIGYFAAYGRATGIVPQNSAERVIWSTWFGYIAAHASIQIAIWSGDTPQTDIIPYAAALAGFGFCVMGAHLWGGCYIIAGVFLVSAPLLQLMGSPNTIVLGLLWWIGIHIISFHYEG